MSTSDSIQKFDSSRADEYRQQSRIALAGYEACHELGACMLAAALGSGGQARVLVAGAGGTAQEILCAGPLEPGWRFTAVDPSGPMLELARRHLEAAGLSSRVDWIHGQVQDVPAQEPFDAATLIGVLHHLPTDAQKRQILQDLAARLRPGAPLLLACNQMAYDSQPLLLSAWAQRWRQQGAGPQEVQAKLDRIRQGAIPPASEAAVAALLADAGFGAAQRFFSSLFWGAWICFKTPD
ncbi:MAG: class I SAM-dependent methyltransferase [Curvibacter sp.]|nr:class I SAM-dependent methyltransferase [Curvibacter sp.]